MLETLPDTLHERSRVVNQRTETDRSGKFLLYWMRTAVRADENPALEVADFLASQLQLPLLIYHAISQRYQYASDRHHTFILQGARDVQRQFDELGLSYAFHLQTGVDRGDHLKMLAHRARVVVTEDMPVDPSRRFLRALQQGTTAPIVLVDTACVVPMRLVGKAYTRAFQFRSATKSLYEQRVTRSWPGSSFSSRRFDLSELPFQPLDLQSAKLAELVATCEIDHSIGPVFDTVGGSDAGYRRWNHFREHGLRHYAKRRNNALLDGVSRMSPYLHYGMVSPFRIAREAAEYDNEGAEKYLDELLIWRELAYAFCFYRRDHDKWSALPQWARQTLEDHAADRRERVYSWEQLARGQTDDALWNAAQQSLLVRGELHNNVRMTWGKAILNWTRTPQEALETIIDLNHRYALDGRDPASYGGILWCLGQFDRPFQPQQNILGTVRPRPTAQHAQRLDPQKYANKVTALPDEARLNVAIVGAGLSGLIAARTLQDHGMKVTVFEKSRGVGGRMSTRRNEHNHSFDHGAQYFTVRDARFRRYVDSWKQQNIVAIWPDPERNAHQKIVVLKQGHVDAVSAGDVRYVAVPGMNAICQHLATGIEVITHTRVTKITPVTNAVELVDNNDVHLGQFDRVIVSAPAEQATVLLAGFPSLAEKFKPVKINPCWATMVTLDQPVTDQWAGAFVHDSLLGWASRNNTKPGRDSGTEQLVLHATPAWTAENLDRAPDEVADMMQEEFWRASGSTKQKPTHLQPHRWMYSVADNPLRDQCVIDPSSLAIACGDWASGSRVEGAFLSGMAAAGRVLGSVATTPPDQNATQACLF